MGVYNDRRPSPRREGDGERALNRNSLAEANAQIRATAPAYRQEETRRKIRTTAVRRFRARATGQGDFDSIGEYVSFITGTGDGGF